jgi:prepilin peptidase CpaA
MTATAAALLLPFALFIGIWAAWNDMKFMKIPNKAVMALLGVWVLAGFAVNPWQVWATGLGLGAAVLLAGFVASSLGIMGAGDAKFAAAMAPFFVQSNIAFVMILCSATMLAALIVHRGASKIQTLRSRSPDWQSWTRRDFPMGLALAGILNIYLALRAAELFAR